MNQPLLRARRLVKHFPVRSGLFGRTRGAVQAVDDISFDLYPGETLALVGESGCGKSTAGKLLLRLIEPTSGKVWFDGRDLYSLPEREVRSLRGEMQVIFQDPYGSLNPRMTVGDMLAEPLRLHGLHAGRERERVIELLGLVGLAPEHAARYPHEFSGGQRQRIGIARALILKPKLVICDEPVSALDVSIRAQIINLLLELKDELGLAYIMISHDLGVVEHVSDRVAVMYLGRIVEQGGWQEIFENPRHPYTRALIAAIPDPFHRAAVSARAKAKGEIASALNPPPGCHFNPRCPLKADRCVSEVPALETVTADHRAACHFRDRTG